MDCPSCHVPLLETRVPPFVVWKCRKCSGCAATIGALRSGIRDAFLQKAWNRAVGHGRIGHRKCPSCAGFMRVLPINGPDIDLCTKCQMMWFDPGELETFPKRPDAEIKAEHSREELRHVQQLHEDHERIHQRMTQLNSPQWFV